jgi:hypothetical protein
VDLESAKTLSDLLPVAMVVAVLTSTYIILFRTRWKD